MGRGLGKAATGIVDLPAKTMGQMEQEIIIKALEAVTISGLGYIVKVVAKVVENVSQIPKMRDDIEKAYERIRELERYSRGPNSDHRG